MSQYFFCNQYNIETSHHNVNCANFDQLCDVLCFDCYNNDGQVIFNIIHDVGNVYTCIDNDKAFDTVFTKCVANDTIPELSHKVFDNHWYKPQRQTKVPCYAYGVAFWHANYIYGTTQCFGLLVLQRSADNVNSMCNESAESA